MAAPARSPGWHRAARRACLLSWVSLVWMTGEGVLGLVAGLRAGSVSLVGIPTWEGLAYLATALDCATKRWSATPSPTTYALT